MSERERMEALANGIWALLEGRNTAITDILNEYNINPNSIKSTSALVGILDHLDNIDRIMLVFLRESIGLEYLFGANLASKNLHGSPDSNISTKTLRTLIQSSQDSFSKTIVSSKNKFNNFFKLSKQTVITENDITNAVAGGLLESANTRVAKDVLFERFGQEPDKFLDSAKLEKYKNGSLKRLKKNIENRGVNAGLKQFMLDKALEDFENQRYIQLVDKNGKIRTYNLKSYSGMVARTRVGEAQVEGTIQEASRYGVTEFKVSDHNTLTEYDDQFEGKVYTLEKKNLGHPKVSGMLDEKSRPLYHPNCMHRLRPFNL